MTQDKKGISAMKLRRHLGISYNAAWRMKHKLMQVTVERDRQHPLAGRIELDDAWLGGQQSGGKTGRGAPGKTPFVAAVQTNDRGHPRRMKLTVVNGFRSVELAAWARQHLCEGSRVLAAPRVHWVNTILGNVKSTLRSTFHSFRPKYAQRYLSEFEYRFNHRFHLPELIPRLAYVALRTPPMPEKLLKPSVA